MLTYQIKTLLSGKYLSILVSPKTMHTVLKQQQIFSKQAIVEVYLLN